MPDPSSSQKMQSGIRQELEQEVVKITATKLNSHGPAGQLSMLTQEEYFLLFIHSLFCDSE